MTPQEETVSPCYCGNLNCRVAYGFCHCRCGGKTRISTVNHSQHGWRKGFPILYIANHKPSVRLEIEAAQPFKLRNVYCRLIALTKGMWAIVDESDYVWLMQWKWYAMFNGKNWYAVRHSKKSEGGSGALIYMHRQILGLGCGDVLDTDHIDTGSTFDNSRLNLRPATADENGHNVRRNKTNKTGRKGTFLETRTGRYPVVIRVKGKRIWLGRHKTFEEACRVRDEAEIKYHGDFARSE